MASGLPIACSKRGPMPELLGDPLAYISDPECPSEIAKILLQYIKNPKLRSKANRSHSLCQQYSWSRCADETLAFLAKVGSEL